MQNTNQIQVRIIELTSNPNLNPRKPRRNDGLWRDLKKSQRGKNGGKQRNEDDDDEVE